MALRFNEGGLELAAILVVFTCLIAAFVVLYYA